MSRQSVAVTLAGLIALAPSWAFADSLKSGAAPLRLAQLTPPPLPQPPGGVYFYVESGKPVGPVTLADIEAKIKAGVITPDTLVWKAGTPSWVAAKQQSEVAPLFAGGPAPTPGPSPSAAPSECTGKVLLADDFKQVDSSWGTTADVVSVEDGKLKVKAQAGGHSGFGYSGRLFKDADYCVTVQSPNNLKDANDPSLLAGFVFWVSEAGGSATAYAVMVAPNGRAAVGRAEKGQWGALVAFRDVSGMNKGAGAKNTVRVSTTGDSIVAYVNGQKFASVRAQAPEKGGEIGFWAQSEKASRDSWKFINLKVTERAN